MATSNGFPLGLPSVNGNGLFTSSTAYYLYKYNADVDVDCRTFFDVTVLGKPLCYLFLKILVTGYMISTVSQFL